MIHNLYRFELLHTDAIPDFFNHYEIGVYQSVTTPSAHMTF